MSKTLTISFTVEDQWILDRISLLKKSSKPKIKKSALVRNLLAVGLKLTAPVSVTEMVEIKELESKQIKVADPFTAPAVQD